MGQAHNSMDAGGAGMVEWTGFCKGQTEIKLYIISQGYSSQCISDLQNHRGSLCSIGKRAFHETLLECRQSKECPRSDRQTSGLWLDLQHRIGRLEVHFRGVHFRGCAYSFSSLKHQATDRATNLGGGWVSIQDSRSSDTHPLGKFYALRCSSLLELEATFWSKKREFRCRVRANRGRNANSLLEIVQVIWILVELLILKRSTGRRFESCVMGSVWPLDNRGFDE